MSIPKPNGLGPNQFILTEQSLHSPAEKYRLTLHINRLALYNTSTNVLIWSAPMSGTPAYLLMQLDGNLVAYTANGTPVWASNTCGDGVSFCMVQDDGNFVVYKQGSASWASNTAGKQAA
jgi:hypothetical protein